MRKLYSIIAALVVLLFANPGRVTAQMYTYLAGTSGNAFPLQTTSSNLCQFLYQPSYFPTAAVPGNITKIYIMSDGAVSSGSFTNLTIKMGNTSLSAFSSGAFVTGLTTVYSAPTTTIPAITAGGWFEVLLQTPFLYTGASNFIVEISQTSYTSGITIRYGAIANARLYGSVTGTTGTAGAGLLNFGFDMVPAGPCTSPPTAGTAKSSDTVVCSSSPFTLNLTGNSNGLGQTYQWQTSTSLAGTYTNTGTAAAVAALVTSATATTYYRCAVTCGTSTTYSTPVKVNVNPLFPAGTYTINSAIATGGTNFQTFNAAVSAISCGVAGPVIFNVASGSGPYNEQVIIPVIGNTSATNTVTFNGNGTTLTYAATLLAAPHTLALNGSDFFRFNNLNITATGATYAMAAHLWNQADNNNFTNCTFTAPANGTGSYQIPFVLNGDVSGPTTSGLSGNNNVVTGCTMNSGYYSAIFVGNSASANTGNQLVNCNLKDFYSYGAYTTYNTGFLMSGCTVERPARTTLSTFYGLYMSTGCTGFLVEKNKFRDPFATATTSTSSAYAIYNFVSATSGSENKFYNNLIYNFNCSGTVEGLYLSAANYVKVYHNTISMDFPGSTSGSVYGIYATGSTSVDIKNNIISIVRGGTGTKYGLYYSSASVTSNRNDVYVNSSAGSNYYGYYLTGYATLAAWKLANSAAWDQQSETMDPAYFSPSTGNFIPNNFFLNNLGTSVGVTTDITNATRSATTPDAGAYEFGEVPPLCLNAPVAPALGSSNACGGALTLRWNRAGGALTYDVYLNAGTGTPTTIISANQTDTFFNTTSVVGPYVWKVVPKNTFGSPTGCTVWNFTTVAGVPATVTITVSPKDTLCIGVPATFTAVNTNGGTAPAYQWKKNSVNVGTNSPTYTDNTLVNGDTVSVVMTSNSTICLTSFTATSNPIRMTINPAPAASIRVNGPVGFCNGNLVNFTGGPSGQAGYQWLNNGSPIAGATTTSYNATISGYYRIRVTGANSCSAVSDSVRVTVYGTPYPSVNRIGNVLSTVSYYASYQWYRNNIAIAGANRNTYTVSRDGSYSVAVGDTAGCSGKSIGLPVNSLDVSTVSGQNDITVFPNPATATISINSSVAVNVSIRSLDGKEILKKENASLVDIHQLAAGIYMLYISDKNNQVLKIEKLVKQGN